MLSPRSFTSCNASAKLSAPQATAAANAPTERPATASASTPAARSARAVATPAMRVPSCTAAVDVERRRAIKLLEAHTEDLPRPHPAWRRTAGCSGSRRRNPGVCAPWPGNNSATCIRRPAAPAAQGSATHPEPLTRTQQGAVRRGDILGQRHGAARRFQQRVNLHRQRGQFGMQRHRCRALKRLIGAHHQIQVTGRRRGRRCRSRARSRRSRSDPSRNLSPQRA